MCRPDAAGEALLREAGERFGWSARAYYRVLKIVRRSAKQSSIAARRALYEMKNLLSRLDLCTR
ncbi:MAG: AAA+ ATPase superfamily protein YifB/ComM, associated with DNA recombination [uncultured Paraburkholderia sp.]|nr:MAG: AAA+ ATPase superfamily protein YifB/ComM, associated with DNA recombination [uncultured Paraburkholderia sp.]CAH2929396.1 MAG: AAA+ ATPase superfamily protein YifB/ComM, associated with DNA recombination [uncultured Paraburkholderia sp.]